MDFMHDNTLCDAKIRVHADEKPRRGRPATKWTLSRQKKLSRMYLCIPREYLRLRKITELLRNDQMGFSTRERNAHGVLKHILDGVELNGRFDQFRIGDKQNARRCLQFLRSVRAQRRAERRARRQRVGSGAQSEFSVQLYPALSQCSSNNVLAGNKSPIGQVGWNNFVNQTRPLIDFDPHPGSQVLINPTSLNNPDLNPTCVLQVPMDLPMTDTLELQPGLPLPSSSMSASNLADTKILGSTSHPLGRSCSVPTIMSSESKSAPKAGSKRESWGSSLSSHLRSLARSSSLSSGRVHTSISTKGAKDPDVHSPLSKLSCHDFLSRLKETKSLTSLLPNNIYSRPKYSNTRLTDEELNNALLEQCCSRQTHCVHRRLEAAIDPQGSPEDVEFAISPEEANAVDKFGNTLLHTAARWGASVPILLAILDRTEDINLTNKRGETFLHVLDPPEQLQSDPSPFVDLIRQLWSRGFPFCQRDIEKRNFLHYLVERKNFPVGALHCFFAEASAACSRFLVAKRSVTGERLYDCVLRKLQGDWAECQNLEELEREVKELELKLKEVRPKRNTLKEYRVGRKKLEESERKLKELEEQLEEERARLPGIFGNETEFIRRYLPEFFENARKPSGNLPGHSVTPGNSPAGPTVPSTHGPDQHNCQRKDGNRNCRHSRTGRTPLMEYLLKIGSQGEPVDEKIMEERVESGEKINLNDRQGNTALHYAAELGIVAALRILCRVQGIGVDKQNNCGNSPLRLVRYALQRSDIQSDAAMEARYLQCAMVLIEAGAHDRGGSKSTSKSRIHGVLGETRKAGRNKRETQRQLKRCRGLHIITLPHD